MGIPVYHWSNTSHSTCEWTMNNFSNLTTNLSQTRKPNIDKQEDTDKPRFEWDFSLSTVISSSTSVASPSDTLASIEFDPTDNFIATGGIARKIRIYSLNSLIENDKDITITDHATACQFYICTPAKLSSLRFRPGSGSRVIGSGDYDGVVMEYDLETRVPVFERDEHGGRRVWSVDYSHCDPTVGASGSDDGTMQIWDTRSESDGGRCVATVRPTGSRNSPLCSVEFNPFGGHTVAVGCADRKAYVYDVRNTTYPILSLDGHEKTVSYVRFLDFHTIVTAGTDGCLKTWNTSQGLDFDVSSSRRVIRTYRGHVNNKNFVGLSVWRHGGLLGCGSENNKVFVYDKRWSEPIWTHGFEPGSGGCGGWEGGFVSSVCWRQLCEERCTLVAGGSDGVLQCFLGKRK